MEIARSFSVALLSIFISSLLLQRPAEAATKSYVVYFGGHSHGESSLISDERVTANHVGFLSSVLGSEEKAKNAIFYSYTRYINGFAANLEPEHMKKIASEIPLYFCFWFFCFLILNLYKDYPGVISIFENKGYRLHTTHSWDFLGLEKNGEVPKGSLWTKAKYGEDIIIGNLDTGVWPESASFKDEGMGPVPTRWRGECQSDTDIKFTCNRKLIGARYFNSGYQAAIGRLNASFNTPRDIDGHGTHTLSTAGGGFVPSVSIFGYGNGTAKGGSPRARVVAYKVCWPPVNGSECFDADILAAYDAAIHDGVDVLSVSLGGDASDYFQDGIAIGSFHAVQNGITVVCSAGNSGPQAATVSNTAPWILTVGASTTDREFPSYISFGNNSIKGQSLSSTELKHNKVYPMINSEEARAANATAHDAQLCIIGCLDPSKVKGKIVVCLRGINARVEKGEAVRQAGGAGMVLANDVTTGNEIIADAHVLPATHISYSDGLEVFSYLKSTKSPLGYITLPKTVIGTKPAPFMAAFSSQGPNTINPEILKPDITGPGVSVIAAYTEAVAPTNLAFDPRRIPYNTESGTSMSCPHLSGVVGLLKSLHPDWSPAAIKSAIMTTAKTQDNKREPIDNSSFVKATPFSYGSGHVLPNHAQDPGLIYDLTTSDYINFLCAIGYNSTQLSTFSKTYSCPSKPLKIEDLNYPSVTIPDLAGAVTVTRKVKNVGAPGTYKVRVQSPRGISVSVKPTTLQFTTVGEEKSFEVKLEAKGHHLVRDYVFGRLIWSDGKHYVRSPLVVKSR